jgi:hypothetical protein
VIYNFQQSHPSTHTQRRLNWFHPPLCCADCANIKGNKIFSQTEWQRERKREARVRGNEPSTRLQHYSTQGLGASLHTHTHTFDREF